MKRTAILFRFLIILLSMAGFANPLRAGGTDTQNIKIEGDGIDESGTVSAYEAHAFHISNPENKVLSDVSWKYSLQLSDGEYSTEQTASGTTSFTIPAVDNPELYKVSANGEISGEITLTATVDGVVINDRYTIYLELKPRIFDVTVVSKELTENGTFYDIVFTVSYGGAGYVRVAAEQEYDTILLNKSIYEPSLAHASFSRLSPFEYTWIEITVENEYGTATYTLEIPPFANVQADIPEITSDELHISEITVYDITGKHLISLHSADGLQTLTSGRIYILRITDSNGDVRVIKYKHT